MAPTTRSGAAAKRAAAHDHPEFEFFGPYLGPLGIMLGLPAVCYALVYACNASGCMHLAPRFGIPGWPPGQRFFTWQALGVYVGWFAFQAALHLLLPGQRRQGVVLPNGSRLTYKLNGVWRSGGGLGRGRVGSGAAAAAAIGWGVAGPPGSCRRQCPCAVVCRPCLRLPATAQLGLGRACPAAPDRHPLSAPRPCAPHAAQACRTWRSARGWRCTWASGGGGWTWAGCTTTTCRSSPPRSSSPSRSPPTSTPRRSRGGGCSRAAAPPATASTTSSSAASSTRAWAASTSRSFASCTRVGGLAGCCGAVGCCGVGGRRAGGSLAFRLLSTAQAAHFRGFECQL